MIKLTYGQYDGSTTSTYNIDGTGYISIGYTPTGTSGGYTSKIAFTKYGLIPVAAKGSATTYYTDGLWLNNSQVNYTRLGGSPFSELCAGAFCTAIHALYTYASWDVSASPSCKPLAPIEEVE